MGRRLVGEGVCGRTRRRAVKLRAPREAWDRPLGESQLRIRYGVTIVGVKRPNEDFTYAQADTVVNKGDLLIVPVTGRFFSWAPAGG